MLRLTGRLWWIHFTSLLAILTAMYFPILDVVLALTFLAIIYTEGCFIARKLEGSLLQAASIALLWQFPALLLILVNIFKLDYFAGLYAYSFFMLEIWQTQLMPLLAFIPASYTYQGLPLYYYFYYIDIPLLMGLLLLPTLQHRRKLFRQVPIRFR